MGLRAKKRLGQHFLHDPAVVAKIVAAIAPQPDDCIVEIGGGLGALTYPLLERIENLRVIELDAQLADALERDWPTTLIKTSGHDVGLPEGTMGNSEVGHQNIGAGRVVDQESVRITKACRGGELAGNVELRPAGDGGTVAELTVPNSVLLRA